MKLKLELKMDNAAFAEDMYGEASRIMEEVVKCLDSWEDKGELRDANGNNVGFYEITEEDEKQEPAWKSKVLFKKWDS